MPGRKNKMSDLRDHLFQCLEDLSDPEKDLEQTIKRAHAIGEVADRIVDTAKVEVSMVSALANSGHDPSAFFDGTRDRLLEEPKQPNDNPGVVRPPLRIAGGGR